MSDIVSQYPQLMEILVNDYGLHCLGCPAARFETLEEGAKTHGYSDKEIEKMVKNLNEKIRKRRRIG